MSALPSGWALARIDEANGIGGVSTDGDWIESKDQDPNGDVRLIQLQDIGDGHFLNKSSRFLTLEKAEQLNCTFLRAGDVLIARMPDPLGRACIFPDIGQKAVTAVDVHVWRPGEISADPDYIKYCINSPEIRASLQLQASGTTRQRVSGGKLKAQEIPVAPIIEQRRIVRKLDALRARTTSVRNHLTAIAMLVERYRQQVFELAFSGVLTHDFREKLGIEDAEGLPRSWRIIELGEVADIQGGIQVGKKRPPGAELVEVPYLRVANVQRGWLNLEEIKFISVTPQEKERLLLESGDVLMNEGGDRDKLGRGWIWRGQVPECIHQNHVFRIRLKDKEFPPEYISHFANAKGQQYFFDEGTQTTNLASISKRKVSALPVPIPPVEEAKEVLRRIEAAFAKIDRLATEVEKALKLTDRFDESILAKAFSGKLVPQDPNDEPASMLLDRLREARIKTPVASRRRVAKKKEERPMQRSLEDVLAEAGDWLPSQEAFRRCGIVDGAETDQIESLYAELRALDKEGRLQVEAVFDAQGRKQHDKLKINADQ